MKTKIDSKTYKELLEKSEKFNSAQRVLKAIEDICQASPHIDPGFEAIERIIRDWRNE